MAKNYYSILGVLPTASIEDIRGAYRNRAKELHPDYYGENSRPFLELQEAYRVLSDPIQRRNYDHDTQEFLVHLDLSFPSKVEPLRPSRSRVENLRSMGEPVNFGEIYTQSSFRTVYPSIEEIINRLWNIILR
jgi:curved DNA-binding protein CbpA